ncbi:hypothetical protein F5887DRAFT_587715 [Amanita rubescens]|nr:hypothetical protein F5887DRAFT_587715 [Amanita rubescens]
MYFYHITIFNDSKMMIFAVYAIYLTETISTGFLAYDLTNLAVDPHYNPCFAGIIVLIGGGLVALLTQAVYAYRIWILMERKRFIPFCFVAFAAIEVILTAVLISSRISLFIVGTVLSACCLFVDLVIAILMVWILTKNSIISRRLHRRIMRLLHILVGGNILTVALNIVNLAASLHSLYLALSCGIVLSRLYANSLMVVVNDRDLHSRGHESPPENNISFIMGTLPTPGNSVGDQTTG